MAIVCHPADALDHAGGTLCLHAQRGDEVTVVVCTHGVETHDLVRNESLSRGDDDTTELMHPLIVYLLGYSRPLPGCLAYHILFACH